MRKCHYCDKEVKPAEPVEVDYISDPVCRLCDSPYAGHPQCQCCSIYCGPGHFQEEVIHYRGHLLCSECIKSWQQLDEKAGQKTPWVVFKNRTDFYNSSGEPIKSWPLAEKARR